jgi:hypothetical protein
MQRVITFQLAPADSFDFNFDSTVAKYQEGLKNLDSYDILSDREELQSVITQVT